MAVGPSFHSRLHKLFWPKACRRRERATIAVASSSREAGSGTVAAAILGGGPPYWFSQTARSTALMRSSPFASPATWVVPVPNPRCQVQKSAPSMSSSPSKSAESGSVIAGGLARVAHCNSKLPAPRLAATRFRQFPCQGRLIFRRIRTRQLDFRISRLGDSPG